MLYGSRRICSVGGYPKTAEVCGGFDSFGLMLEETPGPEKQSDILCRR